MDIRRCMYCGGGVLILENGRYSQSHINCSSFVSEGIRMGRSPDESSRFLEFKNTLNVDDHVQRVTAIESAKRQKLEDQRAPEHLRGGSSGDNNSLPAFRKTDKPSKANGMEELQCPWHLRRVANSSRPRPMVWRSCNVPSIFAGMQTQAVQCQNQ